MKKVGKIIGSIMSVIVLLLLGFVLFLTINEYIPDEREQLPIQTGEKNIEMGKKVSLTTFNIGYGGLDDTQDFFMDGGEGVQPESKKRVQDNLSGIGQILKEEPSDIYLLQEVDRDSKRSYGINQEKYLEQALGENSVFTYNFKVPYVPIPFPPIGRVESGIMTMTDFNMSEASRISLPNPFDWPVRLSNLKRSLLETRYKIQGSEKELVVINLHLEAYDNGNGKIEQSKVLAKVLEQEYSKGNYVIAGGDFNQVFEGSHRFPETGKEGWKPGEIAKNDLPEQFDFVYDDTVPTVRVLNNAYTGSYDSSQVYVIDGFIVSDNVKVNEVKVMNQDFKYSDHHPVRLEVVLEK